MFFYFVKLTSKATVNECTLQPFLIGTSQWPVQGNRRISRWRLASNSHQKQGFSCLWSVRTHFKANKTTAYMQKSLGDITRESQQFSLLKSLKTQINEMSTKKYISLSCNKCTIWQSPSRFQFSIPQNTVPKATLRQPETFLYFLG